MRRAGPWIAALCMTLCSVAGAGAAIVTETYTSRAEFASRLGGAVRTITFDDVDTSGVDPAAFATDRYAPFGLIITGDAGQYASRDFGFPEDYSPSSSPNMYAPGPIEDVTGGGHATEVTFVDGDAPALVAGFGAVFVDPDLPGASSLSVFTDEGEPLGDAEIPAANGQRVFRGVVAVDSDTGVPVAVIASVQLVNGTGWPGADVNDGVPLDDFVFGFTAAIATTTTTTTTTLALDAPPSTTTTTLAAAGCPAGPVAGCRAATAGGATLAAKNKKNDARDTLVWHWRGAATAKADFGDPLGATGYRLCLYDDTGVRHAAELPAGGSCGGKACWKAAKMGFRYRNPPLVPDGVAGLMLKSGGDGKARIALEARGAALGLALPFAPPVTVQLVRADGAGCWDAKYGAPAKSTATKLRATSD
jgi:hypothetical protein